MEIKERSYQFYDTAISICSSCLTRVDGKIVFEDGAVWLLKRCPEHGPEKIMLADDIDYYRRAREVFIKTPEQSQCYNTPVKWGCPYDCGICPDHEQHGCTLLLEITDHCNLRCPTCYANSSPERQTHRSLEQIKAMLDLAVKNEAEPNIIQISGGEPTLHPNFFTVIEEAQSRPIKHLLINTNGLKIAQSDDFTKKLASYAPGIEVYLQFDSLENHALEILRASPLKKVHEQALARLNHYNISTTLVITVRRGVNDSQLGDIIEFAKAQPCVRGVTIQPVQVAGRLEKYDNGYQIDRDRLTLTEVRRSILQQTDLFEPEDIIPVPCHGDSIAMAYALKLDGQFIPLTGLIDPETLINGARNTISYESEAIVQDKLFTLFSTHHNFQSQPQAMQDLLASASEQQNDLSYENIFRLVIMEFIDAYSFDLRSIRKSCVHIIHPDAKRVIPFDTYNLLYRDELEQTVLNPIRAQRTPMRGAISPASPKTVSNNLKESG
ncbi:MAG: radical SAM protein [Colwellia sp.]|nr:radical SAM protein [Colwellia sp.]